MQSAITTVAVVVAGCGSVSSEPGREYPRLSLVDSSGTVLFDRDLRGLITDHAVSLDEAGITIAGNFQERLDLGGGEMEATYSEFEGQYGDMFVARLDWLGREVWHRQIATTRHALPQYMLTDAAGRVVVGGAFFGDIELGATRMAAGATDSFAIAFDVDGSTAWTRQIGDVPYVSPTPANQEVTGVALLPTGDIAVSGTFEYSASLGASSLTAADDGVFIATLGADGAPVRASKDLPWPSIQLHAASATSLLVVHDERHLASIDPVDGRVLWDRELEYVVTDAEYAADGSIAIAGHTDGMGHAVVAVLDSAGAVRSERRVGSDLEDRSWALCQSAHPLADGGVQVAGAFSGVAVVDHVRLVAPEKRDFFARLGPSGEVVTALALEPGARILGQRQGSSVILTYPYWDGVP